MSAVTDKITFDHINRNAQPYPAFMLPQGGTGLALFSAGFHGWNDVIHMARKDMTVTCVDTDQDKLLEMALIYSDAYEFRVEDAYEFAKSVVGQRHWDVVSVDPFMGNMEQPARDSLDLWCALARNLVTFTVAMDRPMWSPPGWTAEIFPRNERVGWMVLHHA